MPRAAWGTEAAQLRNPSRCPILHMPAASSQRCLGDGHGT